MIQKKRVTSGTLFSIVRSGEVAGIEVAGMESADM